MNFLENLYNNLEKRNLRIKLNSVLYDEDDGFATFKFEYDADNLSNEDKEYIKNEIKEYFPDLNFDLKFKKYFFDASLITMLVKDFIVENYTGLTDEVLQEDIYFEGFNLKIKLSSANSVPNANPGALSVIMLIHNKCAGVNIVIPHIDAINIVNTSAIFVDNWN